MLTVSEILGIEREKIARRQPSEEDLRRIPLERPGRIFGRLSDLKQIQESLQSMAELAALFRLARQDGFQTELSPEEVERRLEDIKQGDSEALRYWVDGQLIVDLRDLGISGRLGPDKRPALAEFMADLSSHARAVFEEVQQRAVATGEEEPKRKREEAQLKSRLANLENYLGASDPEMEESYRRQIRQVKADLRALQQKPLPSPVTSVDIDRVRRFLENLESEWLKLSSTLRNRLIKLLIDHVDIAHGSNHIQATIIWKVDFKQRIDIERPVGNSQREQHWTGEQDSLLRLLWPTSTREVMLAAFANRQWEVSAVEPRRLAWDGRYATTLRNGKGGLLAMMTGRLLYT